MGGKREKLTFLECMFVLRLDVGASTAAAEVRKRKAVLREAAHVTCPPGSCCPPLSWMERTVVKMPLDTQAQGHSEQLN